MCIDNIPLFCSYNTIKTWIQAGDAKQPLGPTMHMLAAAEAGILTLLMTNPIWVVKTRLCLQYGNVESTPSNKCYKGVFDALGKIYRNEGVRGLYRVSIKKKFFFLQKFGNFFFAGASPRDVRGDPWCATIHDVRRNEEFLQRVSGSPN